MCLCFFFLDCFSDADWLCRQTPNTLVFTSSLFLFLLFIFCLCSTENKQDVKKLVVKKIADKRVDSANKGKSPKLQKTKDGKLMKPEKRSEVKQEGDRKGVKKSEKKPNSLSKPEKTPNKTAPKPAVVADDSDDDAPLVRMQLLCYFYGQAITLNLQYSNGEFD